MTLDVQVVVVRSPDRPLLTLTQSEAWDEFELALPIGTGESNIGPILATLHIHPDLLLSGGVASKRHMEGVPGQYSDTNNVAPTEKQGK